MTDSKRLKRDLFGEVRLESRDSGQVVVRDVSGAPLATRWIARHLMRREAAALALLDSIPGLPRVLAVHRNRVERSYIAGRPLYEARIRDPEFYRQAMRIVRRIHAAGVVHNDLAKEPNILVTPSGQPALIDFQIAMCPRRRSRLFRLQGREDIRHLLKHKRYYCPEFLTSREQSILAQPSTLTRWHRRYYKPAYLFVTRRLLGWADREGASDLRR